MTQEAAHSSRNTRSPDVSIVIVSWNTRDILHECLQSIIRETRHPCEIIVVDNASADGSAAMIEREFPQILLIKNNTNVGFAAATNQGLKMAAGQNLLILNPDTVILEHAIDKMLVWLKAHPGVGCAGCQVLDAEGCIYKTCFSNHNPFTLLLTEAGLHQRHEYAWWDRGSEKEVGVVTGMFMLIPRHVLDKVGLMDEEFFVYAEDDDLCRRIWKANFRCVFTPVARIIHLGHQSTNQVKYRMHIQQQKSILIYMRKYYGLAGFLLSKGIFIGTSAVRLVAFGLLALLYGGLDARRRAGLAWTAFAFQTWGLQPKQ